MGGPALWLSLAGMLLLSGGCTLASVTEQLTARQAQSCVYTFGFLSPFYAVRTITATGGATIEQCHTMR